MQYIYSVLLSTASHGVRAAVLPHVQSQTWPRWLNLMQMKLVCAYNSAEGQKYLGIYFTDLPAGSDNIKPWFLNWPHALVSWEGHLSVRSTIILSLLSDPLTKTIKQLCFHDVSVCYLM